MEVLLIVCALLLILGACGVGVIAVVRAYHRDPAVAAEMEKPKAWYLELYSYSEGNTFACWFPERLILGRGPTGYIYNDILCVGQHPTVSRKHCTICPEEDLSIRLWNLSEVNPTKHNGVPIRVPVPLRAGDWIRMGDCDYRIQVLEYRSCDS